MIKWINEIKKEEFESVGGKAYNLSLMKHHGFNVPEGFVVPTEAYKTFVSEQGLELHKLDQDQLDQVFSNNRINKSLKEEILSGFTKLGMDHVAVRSSSTAEDLPGGSFAGQYETFLNVTEEDLIQSIKLCWRSLWSERVMDYRQHKQVKSDLTQAVIIQKMVDADEAGISFSANPLNGVRSQIVINVARGLGEKIVSGAIDPDQLIIDKNSGLEIDSRIGQDSIDKVLSDEKIKMLVDKTIEIEKFFGHPQDIEFAFHRGELHILQSRDVTTLYPIDELEQDDKLRTYMSAGTILLGVKEPFTPMGFDVMGQMFPTIINVMTGRKKPISGDFVRYAGSRIYVDLTYLLSSKFVAKKFAGAFSGNDLPLKGVMDKVIEKHGRVFTHQGIRFKIPWRAIKYSMKMIATMKRVKKIPNEDRYNAMIAEGDKVYQNQLDKFKGLKTIEEFVAFSQSALVAAFILSQSQAMYCTEVNDLVKIDKYLKKKFGDQFNSEVLIYSLPRCFTQELTIGLNKLAEKYDKEGREPLIEDEGMQKLISRFGHRGYTELDLGTKRWREDPSYLIDRIKSYMENQQYQRNLKDIEDKRQMAQKMMDAIEKTVSSTIGEKNGKKIKSRMVNYRIAAGMREYPKSDIVRMLGLSRKALQQVGEILAQQGRLEKSEDIFYLHAKDLKESGNLKTLVHINRDRYDYEMKRVRIPRIVMNSGETFYSATAGESSGNQIKGMALSPGIVEGPIRIVNDPLIDQLEEGEIMVCESTNPSWTPLFATAAGLIMEYGGPMSHGGIVAREYGIPAVVGISEAREKLHTGQIVRVDGENGTIELL
jgi:pyruvate,water dikinase